MTLAERTDTREAQQVPMHNIEAEQALLGAIFINNDAFFRVSDFLEAKHFYEPIHQKVFELFIHIVGAGKLATPITMKSFLPPDIDVAGMSAPIYLARLAAEATTVLNARNYGETIRELSDRRELQRIGLSIADAAADPLVTLTAAQMIEAAEADLLLIAHGESGRSGFQRFSEYAKESIDLASKAYQRDGHLSGLATGLTDLDQLMGGLQKGDLVILAGRPSMGKSALAANVAYNIASQYLGKPSPDGTIETVSGGIVGFFSLEMSGEQLVTRIISEQATVPSSRIRRGDISEKEFTNLAETAQRLFHTALFIDETGGLLFAQLASRARRLKREHGLDLLVVDYLQLMQGGAKYRGQRVQEITEITTGLKSLAKELEVPILALSQLSRQVEMRDDKRPQLSDLRESGSIEQDADVVLFVYRDEYYLMRKEPSEGSEEWFKWESALKAAEGKAEVIIGKQRHGPVGKIDLQFDARYTRFSNLARENIVSFNERGI